MSKPKEPFIVTYTDGGPGELLFSLLAKDRKDAKAVFQSMFADTAKSIRIDPVLKSTGR